MRGLGHHHRLLHVLTVEFRRQRIHLELFGLDVKLNQPGLKHRRQPPVTLSILIQRQRACRRTRFDRRKREFAVCTRFWIEPSQCVLGKIGIPHDAFLVGHHVVRRDRSARQIVFGDQHARGTAFGAWQSFECILPFALAAIHRRQIRRQIAKRFLVKLSRHGTLLLLVHAGVDGVRRHAAQRFVHFIDAIRGARDFLERVTAHAIHQRALLLEVARHADEPFAVGQLRREVFGFDQLKFDGLAAGIDRYRAVQLVTHRAYAQCVLTGLHFRGREIELPLVVADHGVGNRRTAFARADQHAFHACFDCRTDAACQCSGGSLRTGNTHAPRQPCNRCTYAVHWTTLFAFCNRSPPLSPPCPWAWAGGRCALACSLLWRMRSSRHRA